MDKDLADQFAGIAARDTAGPARRGLAAGDDVRQPGNGTRVSMAIIHETTMSPDGTQVRGILATAEHVTGP